MEITSARVMINAPRRNFQPLKIESDQGACGIGDATLKKRGKSVVRHLEDHVIPCLIGKALRQIGHIWRHLYPRLGWRSRDSVVSMVLPMAATLPRWSMW